ncbi:hypothetical protein SUGI_0226420 [Cryptomeria japonica]|nr:hypothetical protein SUGI_0226420 [Cryptomeria japonica]
MCSADITVDMEDALLAYRETHDVLKFVDWPDNIVVDLLNIFGTLNFEGFFNSIRYEGKMLNVERKVKQGLGTSVEEKRERSEEAQELTTEERKRVGDLGYCLRSRLTASDTLWNRLEDCGSKNESRKLLHTLVGRVIVSCLFEAADVRLKCRKQWVQNFEERKMERGIELAGKVSGLIRSVGGIRSVAETGEVPSQMIGWEAGEEQDIEAAAS